MPMPVSVSVSVPPAAASFQQPAPVGTPPPEVLPVGARTRRVLVYVVKARDLMAGDTNGSSDPYARVRLGDVEHDTVVVAHSRAPEWNELLSFELLLEQPIGAKGCDPNSCSTWSDHCGAPLSTHHHRHCS